MAECRARCQLRQAFPASEILFTCLPASRNGTPPPGKQATAMSVTGQVIAGELEIESRSEWAQSTSWWSSRHKEFLSQLNAASPILHEDLCFVNFGPDEKARLIAVSKKDGSTAWEAEAPKLDPSEIPQMRGPGGRGGFGPGMMAAGPMMAQGDKNADKKLSREEMIALAEAWFDKLDNEKNGTMHDRKGSAVSYH
jgi:hypothetical protein